MKLFRRLTTRSAVASALAAFGLVGLAAPTVRADDSDSPKRVVLISAHSPDQISILNDVGETLWTLGEAEGVDHPQDAAVLDDGSVFFSVMFGAKTVKIADKTPVWSYSTPEGTQNPVAQPLDDGYFLVGNEGPCRLLELNATGDVRREVRIADPPFKGSHGQFRFCRKTPEGTYLFPMVNAGILRECDAAGTTLREFPVTGAPVCAVRLPNGETLAGDGSAVDIFDANGEIVWRFDCVADAGFKPGIVTAVSRLKNGNVLFGYYQTDPETPDVVEVTPEKKIVWSLTLKDVALVAAVQALDENFKPSPEVLAR